jgi:flagellar hook-basal body complex protein FliE
MESISKSAPVNTYLSPLNATKAAREDSDESFGRILQDSLNEVNKLQNQADRSIERLATGEEKDIHNTMIMIQKAQISFELMTQIQNRLLTAYDELRRMQI